ncbi:MAG: serine hydrolase [Bacteroidia bacterium]|nr:serine hydrolase [Bacteroidia bacterium]
MRKPFIFPPLILLLLLIITACSQSNKTEVQITARRTNLVDSLLNHAVNNQEVPGAVAFISQNGKIVFHQSYGYRNLEYKLPLLRNDIFRMASMTKGLTAVAVLQLYERGLLLLDDPVSKYIPEFRNPQVLIDILPDSGFTAKPASGEITIRQLLTHTSGIGYGFQDERYNKLIIKNNISEGFEDDDRTSLENIRRLGKIPLLYDPGVKYTYGLSYDVLGVVIEIVSGLRFDRYIKQFILDPLGMDDSYFVVPEKEQYRLVTAYQPAEKGNGLELTTYPDTVYPRIKTRRYFSGGADLCSTAEDYGKFIQMVMNKGVYNHTRILGERFIKMMLSKQTRLDDGSSDQGFSAWVTNEKGAAKGPMTLGSFGFGGFWDTYGWADVKGNFVAMLLLQMYPTNKFQIHEKFKKIVYGR